MKNILTKISIVMLACASSLICTSYEERKTGLFEARSDWETNRFNTFQSTSVHLNEERTMWIAGAGGLYRFNSDGGIDWYVIHEFEPIVLTVDSNQQAILGGHVGASDGSDDARIAVFSSSGNSLDSFSFGSDGWDVARSIHTFADHSDLVIAGDTAGDLEGELNSGHDDMFITRRARTGGARWTTVLGSTGWDGANDVVCLEEDGDEVCYAAGLTTGDFAGTQTGVSDAVLVKLDGDNGDVLWQRQVGSAGFDSFNGISVANDVIHVVGHTEGALFRAQNLGGTDSISAAYDPDGNLLWSKQQGTSGNDIGVEAYYYDGFYTTGTTTGVWGETNWGSKDVYLLRHDSNGGIAYKAQMGSPLDDDYLGGMTPTTYRWLVPVISFGSLGTPNWIYDEGEPHDGASRLDEHTQVHKRSEKNFKDVGI